MRFISKTNEAMHKEELVRMKHRRSIFEKSYGATFRSIRDAERVRMPINEREELTRLLSEIILHEIFFSSFDSPGKISEKIRKKRAADIG